MQSSSAGQDLLGPNTLALENRWFVESWVLLAVIFGGDMMVVVILHAYNHVWVLLVLELYFYILPVGIGKLREYDLVMMSGLKIWEK